MALQQQQGTNEDNYNIEKRTNLKPSTFKGCIVQQCTQNKTQIADYDDVEIELMSLNNKQHAEKQNGFISFRLGKVLQ